MNDVSIEAESLEKTKKPKGRPKKEDKDNAVKATKPEWRPSSRLATLKAKPGFTARWVDADPANVARKKAEGWLIMRPEDNVGPPIEQIDVNDGKALHNGIRYRDMIAMMLPNDLKSAREEYYREEHKQAMAGILKETDQKLGNMGVQVTKPKGSPGRIVIE